MKFPTKIVVTSLERRRGLLLAVVAIGVGAATIAVIDGAGGGHVEGAADIAGVEGD